MSRGKLVVIDGLDGTGKATQVELLKKSLIKMGMKYDRDFTVVDFPRYHKPSATMVEKYLSGEFGKDPSSVDCYTASMFYAIDRSLSYKSELWGEIYNNGGLVICDRYTSSNILHQGSKLSKTETFRNAQIKERESEKIIESSSMDMMWAYNIYNYMLWLYTLEYDEIGIPKPDLAIFLELTEGANESMLRARKETAVNGDIHEANVKYLNNCRACMQVYKNIINGKYSFSENISLYGLDFKHSFLTVSDDEKPFSKEIVHDMIMKELDAI